MPLPASFQSFLSHPDPGFIFPPHPHANAPRRARSAPHRLKLPASPGAMQLLNSFVTRGEPRLFGLFRKRRLPENLAALSDLFDFYKAHDGIDLFVRPDTLNGGSAPCLSFLSIADLEAARLEVIDNGSGWMLEGLEHIYTNDNFAVIAASPSEGTMLTVLLDHGKDPAAKPGAIYYLSMDPVADAHTPFAPTLSVLLDRVASDPTKFLNDIGFTASIRGHDRATYGDPVESYSPNIRSDPDFAEEDFNAPPPAHR